MTDIEKKVLETIIAFKKEHGFSPTYREIGIRIGLKSSASVAEVIRKLIIEGYISDPKHKKRAIKVLKGIETERNQLKPCPLCGGMVRLTEITTGTPYNNGQHTDHSATLECDCGLSFTREWTEINATDGIIKVEEDIFTAWNRRCK